MRVTPLSESNLPRNYPIHEGLCNKYSCLSSTLFQTFQNFTEILINYSEI